MANPHSPEELAALSTLIHNLLGWLLLALAVVAGLEQRRGIPTGKSRFIWPGLGALIGFGLTIYVTAHQVFTHRISPFADPVQLQHELIGLVAGAGATLELLRRRGWLSSPLWEAAWPLSLLGIGVIFVAHEQGTTQALLVHWFLAASLILAGLSPLATVLAGEPARAMRLLGVLLLACASVQLISYREQPGAHQHKGHDAMPHHKQATPAESPETP